NRKHCPSLKPRPSHRDDQYEYKLRKRSKHLHIERILSQKIPTKRTSRKHRHKRWRSRTNGILPIRRNERFILRNPPRTNGLSGLLHGSQSHHKPMELKKRTEYHKPYWHHRRCHKQVRLHEQIRTPEQYT